MLFSGLALIPGDLGDARLINYLLEHTWRWLIRDPLHLDLWNLPVFYPTANTAAYSDLLFSAGPFYWCWRSVGLPMDTAFQLWLLTVASLNYLTMFVFLVRVLRLRGLPSALGALLFTAAACRVAESFHPQLLVQFYTIVALHALVRFFETAAQSSPVRPGTWFGVFAVASVLQIYASYYLGWFLGLAILVAMVAACIHGSTRRTLFSVLRRRWRVVVGWTGAAAVLTAPLVWHYLLAAHDLGLRSWWDVAVGLPSPAAWFLLDRSSWPYGWIPVLDAPQTQGLEALGVGFLTPAVAAWGLWRRRGSPFFSLLAMTAVVLVVLVTAVGPASLWIGIYFTVPGAAAIRAAYRIVLVVLIAGAVGAAIFIQDRKRVGIAAALALLCVLEQGRAVPTFSKDESRRRVSAVASRIPADCAAFLYTPHGESVSTLDQAAAQVDAMWAGLEVGKPTINGYSGGSPPGYPFAVPIIRDDAELPAWAARLNEWCKGRGLDRNRIVWIHGH